MSVVMPAYNASAYVDAAIQSIRDQTHQSWELLVIDDGSTDDTADRADAHAKCDARIRVIREAHCGISSSLNRGVLLARHEWIAIMHADDVSLPHRLSTQLAAAHREPDVLIWGSYAQHISATGQRLGVSQTGPTSVAQFGQFRESGRDIYVIHPTMLVRKRDLMRAGLYDSRFDGSEDLELQARMARLGPVVAIPQSLVLYRIHAGSVTMRRFFEMRQCARFIAARQRAGDEGVSLELAKFTQRQRDRSLWQRAAESLDDHARYHYRCAGLAIGSAQPLSAVGHLLLATIVAPHYSLPRVWNQVFSRRARAELQSELAQSAPWHFAQPDSSRR